MCIWRCSSIGLCIWLVHVFGYAFGDEVEHVVVGVSVFDMNLNLWLYI